MVDFEQLIVCWFICKSHVIQFAKPYQEELQIKFDINRLK